MSRTSTRPTPPQAKAADPRRSVWVTANAGTGKTRVLTDRVLHLLLDGAEPEGILCLPFTKAAAAEMAVRVEQRLAGWVAADEAALAVELTALCDAPPEPARLTRARLLFARVLELPRGLPIMTIHALCGALLRRFPIEAGVAPHFETIDERTAAELLREALAQALRAGREDRGRLGWALEVLAVTLADLGITEALRQVTAQRLPLLAARRAHRDTEGLVAAIHAALDAEHGLEPVELDRRACADGVFDARGLLAAANALAGGDEGDRARARTIVTWLECAAAERPDQLPSYRLCFLTKDGKGRQRLMSKAVTDEAARRTLQQEQARLLTLEQQRRGLMVARRTEALVRVALEVIDRYEALKAAQAVLDYDDLIERANALLAQPGKSDWVRFKLDARIDHVLVDEAQDTSPAQWRLIRRLTDEFFTGAGARDVARTLFVVGDEKQSIYSFQGADLANYRRVRAELLARAADALAPIDEITLDRSFRSVPAILATVDAVFAQPAARPGVVDLDRKLRHEAERAQEPGLVELWPLAEPAAGEPVVEPWPLPNAARIVDEPERRIARAIATTVRGWLDGGELLSGSGRPIGPGDVMILLARRGILQERLVRALKLAGVPVAGADRLALHESIAVQDLIALGHAVLLPEDDLNLACLLKSPLVGLDETDLFELAHGRDGTSLQACLHAAAARTPERFGPAAARLAAWLERADLMPPFEFFAWVLGADGGRQRLLARLGPEATEPIEGFLAQALAYEQGHPPTLQGFLHWLSLGTDQLKRDPEHAGDAVRVVTVHGAKGLEAPIVFLADAGPRARSRSGRLRWTIPARDGDPPLPLWRASQKDGSPLCRDLAERETRAEEEERRRLLYVALTRARDRLYVTGWLPRSAAGEDVDSRQPAATCWHDLVASGLRALPDTTRFTLDPRLGLPGEALRLARGVAVPAPLRPASGPTIEPALPDWMTRPAVEEPAATRGRPPSGRSPELETGEGGRDPGRFRRGLLVHRLLQFLPDLAATERPAAARRLLAAVAPELAAHEREALAVSVLDLLARPELARCFGPGSRAEQAISGTVGGAPVIGQIDRLLITDDEVRVIDLKSNRRPPPSPAAIPAAYLAQLATYRALLRDLFPDRPVRCCLLWTELPRLDEIPDALLDGHAADSA